MIPSIGRIVHLRLSAECAKSINRRREDAKCSCIGNAALGCVVHAGNSVKEGDIFPLLITRVWADQPTDQTAVNGQVLLDGNDTFWATSVAQGDGSGQWFEPPRV